MSTVPIFAPDGTLGDIPFEHMKAAIAAGGKLGVTVKAPTGELGVVPADRAQDAAKAGGTIVPFKEQETQHPGFWASAADDLKGLLHPSGFSPYPGMDQEAKSAAATQSAQQDQSRKAAGYSSAYRALAPVAQAVGANVPGMEQSAKEGDQAGVMGHAAAPVMAYGAIRGAEAAADALPSTERMGQYAAPVAKAVAKTVDVATFDRIGKIWNAWKNLPEEVRARGPQFKDPGAPLPENPPTELLQARNLAKGGAAPAPSAASALGNIAQPKPAAASPAPAASVLTESAAPVAGDTIPRTLNGESALRQVLTGQDNANLLKIAKARGINVTKEAQLKAGIADKFLVNKIVDDFAPDELSEVGAQYLENSRFRHAFGDIGPEAWKTMSLQTYFPELKIAAAKLARTAKAVATPATPSDDLTGILQQSLAQAKARQ